MFAKHILYFAAGAGVGTLAGSFIMMKELRRQSQYNQQNYNAIKELISESQEDFSEKFKNFSATTGRLKNSGKC